MQAVLRNKTAKHTKIKHLWERTTNTVVLFLFVAWEQRELGELCQIEKGEQLGKSEMTEVGAFYVLNGGVEPSGYTDKWNTPANTISISEGGNSCGYVNFNNCRFWSGGHNYTLKNPRIVTIYLYQFLKANESKIMAKRVGSGLPNIQKGAIATYPITFPKEKEQEAIAELLGSIDNLITLHQRKHFYPKYEKNSVFDCKKTANDWEQRKLGDLFDFRYGDGNINPSNGGQYPVYGAGGIQGGYTFFNAENSIIIGHMGDAGCVTWGEGKHFVTYNGTITKPKEGIFSSKFGYYLLLKMNLRKFRGGSGLPFLTYEMLTEMKTWYPRNDKETENIAIVLTQIDNLITLHQRKHFLTRANKVMLTDECKRMNTTNDWEQRKANDICSITTGKSNTQDQVENGAYPFYIRSDTPVRSHKFLYDCEAVITIGDGNIGKVFHYVNGKFDLHQRCYKMADFKEILGKFFFYYFSTKFYDRAMKMTAKATVDSVRLEMISEMDILFPIKLDEQRKISVLLTQIDNLITLHQCKGRNKNSHERERIGMGKNINPTNDWEQRKVGEIANRFDNLRIPVAANLRKKGTTPYYGANGIQDYVDGFTHEGEFVLVAEDGANDLKNYPVKCVKGKIWVNNHAHVLQGKEKTADNHFLAYLLNRTDIESLLVGGGRAKLNAETMMGIEILLPKIEEQEVIGTCILKIDNLITLHQRKWQIKTHSKLQLEKYKKKGKGANDWEQRKAGEVFVDVAEKGFPHLPVLSATQDMGMVRRDETGKNIFHDKKNEEGYKRVCPGQFVIHLRSFQGGFAHSSIEGITSPAYTVFEHKIKKMHDDYFWKYIFSSKQFIRRLETVTYGIRDGRSISYEEFLTMDFTFPSREEQNAIAQVLLQIDNLITLHRCKDFFKKSNILTSGEKLSMTKKTNAWEQREYSELASTRRGLTYSPNDIVPKGVRVLRSSNIKEDKFEMGEDDVFVCERVIKIDFIKDNDILITSANGSTRLVGKHAIIVGIKQEKAVHGGFMLVATANMPFFVNALMSAPWYAKFINLFVAGGNGAIGNLNKNDLDTQVVFVPQCEEQKQIGQLFKEIDNLITLHQRGNQYIQENKK